MSILLFHWLQPLHCIALEWLTSLSYVQFALLSLSWVNFPLLETLLTVASSSWQHPRESPVCVGPTAAHYCLPIRSLPQIWYWPLLLSDPLYSLPYESVYLPQSPLFFPPCARPPSPLHIRFDSLPSVIVPLLRSPLLFLHRNRPPLWRTCRHYAKSLSRLNLTGHHSSPCYPGS